MRAVQATHAIENGLDGWDVGMLLMQENNAVYGHNVIKHSLHPLLVHDADTGHARKTSIRSSSLFIIDFPLCLHSAPEK